MQVEQDHIGAFQPGYLFQNASFRPALPASRASEDGAVPLEKLIAIQIRCGVIIGVAPDLESRALRGGNHSAEHKIINLSDGHIGTGILIGRFMEFPVHKAPDDAALNCTSWFGYQQIAVEIELFVLFSSTDRFHQADNGHTAFHILEQYSAVDPYIRKLLIAGFDLHSIRRNFNQFHLTLLFVS